MNPPTAGLWILRALAGAAAGVAGYLLILSVSNQGLPAGCGAGSGCADVLTSRWASLFGVSVTAPALATYAGILVASFAAGSSKVVIRAIGWHVLLTLAATLLFGAAWFMALQGWVIGHWCPWCLAEHALGLLTAGLAIGLSLRSGSHVPLLSLAACTMIGMFLVGLLAAGQTFGPAPKAALVRLPADRNADTGPGKDRQISVLNGSLPLRVDEELTLGDPQAKHLIVVMFDYCCPHCRETHGHLVEGLKAYRGQYGLVMLPMPLDKSCNPHVDETESRFENACELAKLALAVWSVDRSKYAEFDQWLCEPEQPRALAEAQKKAEALVSAERLQSALADPKLETTIQRNVAAYAATPKARIPLILSPEFPAIVGRPEPDQLFEVLEQDLKLSR